MRYCNRCGFDRIEAPFEQSCLQCGLGNTKTPYIRTKQIDPEHRLPVFVYGTLRSGRGNYALMEQYTVEMKTAVVEGQLFYTGSYLSIPALAEGTDLVCGELYWLNPNKYSEAVCRLDHLEGYDPIADKGMYLRRAIMGAWSVNKTCWAWTYYWNHRKVGPKILNCDYINPAVEVDLMGAPGLNRLKAL